MASERFSVSWDNFHKNMSTGMNSLLENEDFVDVTLAMEGRYLKAHKMVLSVCSLYFRDLFKTSPCKHPIVFMKDVSYTAMCDLLQFMYQGQVQVNEENFDTFIKTAESLQISGLSHSDNIADAGDKETPPKEDVSFVEPEVPKSQNSALKEPHLTPSPTPVHSSNSSTVKLEAVTTTEAAECISSKDNLIQFKMEPCDQELSPSGNFSDDPLDDPLDENTANDDKNENFWMVESGEENPLDSTSAYNALEGEEINVSDIEEVPASSVVIPEKSKDKYEYAFTRFEQWCGENDVKYLNENVLMTYFKEKSLNYKSSSLWTIYSMLRSMISIKKNVDISKYKNVVAFLKRKSQGYKAKKSQAFMREEFERFLKEARNDTYLMMKVAMIMGVVGACTNSELTNLRIENVIDEGNLIKVQILDGKNRLVREFIVTAGNIVNINLVEIIRTYMCLRADHQRFFVAYRHGKCVKQPVGINMFGSMPKSIAQFLGLPNANQYTGHSFRRTAALLKLVPRYVNFT